MTSELFPGYSLLPQADLWRRSDGRRCAGTFRLMYSAKAISGDLTHFFMCVRSFDFDVDL